MKNILVFLLFLGVGVSLSGQSNSNTIFTKSDKIYVNISPNSDFYYNHQFQKGHSLYALSRVFDVPLNQLYAVNGLKKDEPLQPGQTIKVPLKQHYLFKGLNLLGLKYGHYIPVFYKTKTKDNLFRISRIYFDQPTEDLKKRNNLKSNNLSLDQEILVGWWPIDSAEPRTDEDEFEENFGYQDKEERAYEAPEENSTNEEVKLVNLIDNEDDLDSNMIMDVPPAPDGFNKLLLGNLPYRETMQEIKKAEVANWDKSMPDNGTVYVLHRDAVIDSYIQMYNPILRRSVLAKVIGRIPYGAYTNNVSLVLSPRAAKQLGALDKRFKVEVQALVELQE